MVDFRSRQESTPAAWYGYPTTCGTNIYTKTLTMLSRYESVESYRGKPEYISIGSKRRKVFHYFKRYKEINSGLGGEWWWCPNPPTLTMWSAMNLSAFYIARAAKDKEYWESTPWYQNTDWPIFGEQILNELGNEYREFIVRDLFAKANSPRFNGAIFLAELDETLVGIHKLLLGSVRSLFRTSVAWKQFKHFAVNPQELWLWFRYMLIPTMLDVEDLIKAVGAPKIIDRVQDGSRLQDQLTTGTFRVHGWPRGGIYYDLEVPFRSEWKLGCGGAIDIYSRYDPHEWGTSAQDIVAAAWERIPFSFVADWFINVGDWLASLRSLEIAYAQSYATYAIESRTFLQEGTDVYMDESPVLYSYLQERIVNLEPPPFPLIDKKWANCTRMIDLISLTIGMLKGILKRRR